MTADSTDDVLQTGSWPDLVQQAHRTATNNGWSVETRVTPEDPERPAVIVSVIQRDSLPGWVGLQDPDDPPPGARVIASRPAPVRFQDFQTGQLVRVRYREDRGAVTTQTGIVTVAAGSVRLGAVTFVDWDELDLLQVLQPTDPQ